MENTHTTETAPACQKSETTTMTPRQQREHLFAIREQDAPSPYVMTLASVAEPVDEVAFYREQEQAAYAKIMTDLAKPMPNATADTLAHALRLCELLEIDLARLAEMMPSAEPRLHAAKIAQWLLTKTLGFRPVPDDGTRYDLNEKGNIVRSVILPDEKIELSSIPVSEKV